MWISSLDGWDHLLRMRGSLFTFVMNMLSVDILSRWMGSSTAHAWLSLYLGDEHVDSLSVDILSRWMGSSTTHAWVSLYLCYEHVEC